MSDPVSNAEIEDVLSSIRRLVSQRADAPVDAPKPATEARGATLSEVKPMAEAPASEPPALVLTPSLRVADPKTKSPVREGEEGGSAQKETVSDGRDLGERVAGLEAAMDAAEGQWEPDGSEEQNLPTDLPWRAEAPSAPVKVEDAPAAPMAVDVPQEPLDAETLDTVMGSLSADEELQDNQPEATEAADISHADVEVQAEVIDDMADTEEATLTEGEAPAEEPLSQVTPAEDAESFVFHSERAAASWPEEGAETIDPEVEEEDEFGSESQELTDPPISLRLHLIEGSVGHSDVGAKAIGAEVHQFAEAKPAGEQVTVEEWQDADDEAPIMSSEAAAASFEDEEDEEDLDLSFLDEPEALLDEEELRVMVADIVREELRGELGEKITHTLRKLVRREIARALSTRELE
ncbi:hypothetical protein IV417_17420 [Alphaproteobacteria bacterium KMM 3653]|uniref:Uncharacterized protein n=1 Tax=Harenicola maris TaxID=2841044 RepID=A0AAP2G5A2_9RHOB|nr:hypothetical protein [Harenicola maris]